MCIAQDRAHLMQVLSHQPIVHALSFRILAAVWRTTLRSRPFNRYGRRCQFSWRQPGRRQRLKQYAYSYWTEEAPGRRQRLGPYAYSYRTEAVPGWRQRLGLYAYSYRTEAPRWRQQLGPYLYSYRTEETPGRWQRPGSYAYSYRTQEAQFKPDCHTEGRRIGSWTTLAYSFLYFFFILYIYFSIYIISLLNIYSHFLRIPSLLLLIFQIHKLLHGRGARHAFAHCICLVNHIITYTYVCSRMIILDNQARQ